MKNIIRSALFAAVAALVASPVAAQERAFQFNIRGGGFNALTSLDEAETADFKEVGFNIGGGVGFEVNRNLMIRTDFGFARNDLRIDEVAVDSKLDRFFYDAALQVQFPSGGWKPYVFVGGGGVTLDPEGPDNSETRAAGTGGVGLDYEVGNGLGIGVEAKGWLFDFSESGGALSDYDKTQFEVTWGLKLSYLVPIG